MASLTLVKLLQFLLQELHKPAAPSQSTAKWSSNTSYFTLSILWAFIDLLNVVMNTSVSSDKVSLVNLSESTPNSVLGPRGSHSAKEAANFLIISSDLQALSLFPSVSILPPFHATASCILPSVILHHVCETPPAKVPWICLVLIAGFQFLPWFSQM